MESKTEGGAPAPESKNELAPVAALPKEKAAWDAWRRGDFEGLLKFATPAELATLAIETRRESIAVLGTHEAFVRKDDKGHLTQVIRPVRLSEADGTLFRLPRRRPVKKGTKEVIFGNAREYEKDHGKGTVEWVDFAKNEGLVTAPGYNRQNGVAGCSVGLPPYVYVDGERKTNPYVQRTQLDRGRLGDIIRVVISCAVVGPAPATGNPVVMNYTLDYDPSKDLQHMIAEVAAEHPDQCYLVDEEEWLALPHDASDEGRRGWKFLPIHGGVGFAFDLSLVEIREVYTSFVNLAQNAVKKAQTVVRRNAMRAHPAFVQQVICNDEGVAIIPVVGWVGDAHVMDQWRSIQEKLARGQALPDEVQYAEVVEDYDPKKDNVVDPDDAATRTTVEEASVEEGQDPPPAGTTGANADTIEKNKVIAAIDEGLHMLDDLTEISALGYDPKTQDLEALRIVWRKLQDAIDKKAVK